MLGLVLPPQFSNIGQNIGQSGQSISGETSSSNPLESFGINISDVKMPQLMGEPHYNPDTGQLDLAINATNPSTTPISVEQLSVQILSKNDSSLVGTISIPQAINIQPGQSAVINISGVIPEELYKQLGGQGGNVDLNNIEFKNFDAIVAGVKIHFDEFDPSTFLGVSGQ
jgi:hypothetical protein